MVDSQLVENWLDKADEDLAFAKASLQEGLEFYPQICFYLHQAAEKYLKAYIIAKGLSFQKIHDLTQLVQVCTECDPEFNKYSEVAQLLNPFYIGTRYPDFIILVNKSNAEKALEATDQIASFVKSKLKSL